MTGSYGITSTTMRFGVLRCHFDLTGWAGSPGEFFLQRVENWRIPPRNLVPQEIEELLYRYPAAAEAWRDRRTGSSSGEGPGGVRDAVARRAGGGADRFYRAAFGGLQGPWEDRFRGRAVRRD